MASLTDSAGQENFDFEKSRKKYSTRVCFKNTIVSNISFATYFTSVARSFVSSPAVGPESDAELKTSLTMSSSFTEAHITMASPFADCPARPALPTICFIFAID